jgi:hypothetical protein
MKKTINKTLLVLAVTTGISMASVQTYASPVATKTETDVSRDANGNYVKNTSVTGKDSNGTNTSTTSKVKVKVDTDGDYKKTIENKTVIDPKGLMNKSTVKTNETLQKKNGDNSYHYTKKINGKTVKDEALEYNKK